jgi:hypothetical protein
MLPVLKAQVDGMRSSGFTASYAFDQVVLRSEGLMTSPLESKGEQASLRQLVMAADITYEQLLLGLQEQYVDSSVHQGEEHRTTQNWWGVYGQYNFSALNITLQGLIYRKLAGQDQFHREGVQFALGDNGRLSLVHEGFAGEKEPLLNLLEHEDRISGEVSFVF